MNTNYIASCEVLRAHGAYQTSSPAEVAALIIEMGLTGEVDRKAAEIAAIPASKKGWVTPDHVQAIRRELAPHKY